MYTCIHQWHQTNTHTCIEIKHVKHNMLSIMSLILSRQSTDCDMDTIMGEVIWIGCGTTLHFVYFVTSAHSGWPHSRVGRGQ